VAWTPDSGKPVACPWFHTTAVQEVGRWQSPHSLPSRVSYLSSLWRIQWQSKQRLGVPLSTPFRWHAAQGVLRWRPSSGKIVFLWNAREAFFQIFRLWQDSHRVPSVPLCASLWQLAHCVEVPLNTTAVPAPDGKSPVFSLWQSAQGTVPCLPAKKAAMSLPWCL